MSTQFWSTYTGLESVGQVLPKESWTLHGLWPDFCDGSYTQYCDLRYVRFCFLVGGMNWRGVRCEEGM